MIRRHVKDLQTPSAEEIQQLVYELEVHRTELELQNEALREAQQDLEASRDRYVDLYDFAPVGYVTLDAQGSIHRINLTAARLLGTERTRLIGKRLTGYLAKGHQQPFRRHLQACAAGPAQASCEVLLCPKTGPPVPAKLDTVRVDDEQAPRFRTAITDISERKRVQEELEQARNELEVRVDKRTAELRKTIGRLRTEIDDRNKAEISLKQRERFLDSVFEGIQDGLCVLDSELTVVRANHWMEDKYTDQQPFVGKKCYTVFQGRQAPCPGCPTVQVLEDGEAHDAIVPYPAEDHPLGWLQLSSFPLTTDTGEVAGVIEHIKDISDVKQAEEKLRQSEERYRAMFENITAVKLLIDPSDGKIVDANRAACNFYGYSRDQLLQMEIQQINVACKEEVLLAMERARRRECLRFEFGHRLSSGEVRSVEVHAGPIQIDGRTLLFSIVHDITVRKDLEREVSAAVVREQQLIGQELHDGLGQHLLGIGLMTKGLETKLRKKGLSEAKSADELVRQLTDAHDHVRKLIEGIRPVGVAAGGLMTALGELAASTQRLADVRCTFECPEPVGLTDDHTATQVFYLAQEAVRNAVKHARAKQITIGMAQDDRQIRLSVGDDGVGWPSETVWNEGMGLRIMNYRASLIGGTLAIGPAPDGGTLLTCVLPVV
jgi:PAS domain S-box-containing protein